MTITAEIPRPRIDAVTAWRVGQIAHAEHRSLSNALFVLVAEAWDARMDAKLKALAPNMPRGDARS
jgi:hypothetical protein